MREIPKLVRHVAWALYAVGLVASGAALVHSSTSAARQYDALLDGERPGAVSQRATRRLLEILTFGWYEGAAEERRKLAVAQDTLEASRRGAFDYALALLCLTLLPLVPPAWRLCHDGGSEFRRSLGRRLCTGAAVFFVVGILTPVLTIEAHQQVAVLGRVVLKHETKTFIGTVSALAEAGHLPVAALLALFSLIVPALKLVVLGVAVNRPSVAAADGQRQGAGRDARRGRYAVWPARLLQHLGRWSMTDVFVVAVLVAFFATDASGTTTATVGIGLYFFAAHTLLGVMAGMFCERPAGRPENG